MANNFPLPERAILAAAGKGTRFMPWTKTIPKEMLPLGDRPVIDHVVESLLEVGNLAITIVTAVGKTAIAEYYAPAEDLENHLKDKGKRSQASKVQQAATRPISIIYQQGRPPGNARPLLNALDHRLIEESGPPFFYMYADDYFEAEPSHASQLLDAYLRTGKSVISLVEVDPSDADKYGMAAVSEKIAPDIYKVTDLLEKPGAARAPSKFAAVGGYLLTSEIIPLVKQLAPSPRGEIELPEAIGKLAACGGVVGRIINGKYRDAGTPASFAAALHAFMLNSKEFGAEYIKIINSDR